jgi:hypothetical protein
MDYYQMPKDLDFENLRYCLDNYKTNFILIASKFSAGGKIKVREELDSRILDFKKDDSGLSILIDKSEVFNFPLKYYQKGFSLAYERFHTEDGSIHIPYNKTFPDDPSFPVPSRSILINVIDQHIMEIYFKGKIPLEFHSWWNEPHSKYWNVKKH